MGLFVLSAEKGGFEPPVQLPVRQFSKLLVSATHPSLRCVREYLYAVDVFLSELLLTESACKSTA